MMTKEDERIAVIRSELEAERTELRRIRRYLHEHPELSGFESGTLSLIRAQLSELRIPFVEVEKGGILATLRHGSRQKTVLLRADMDALPIQECAANTIRAKEVVSQVDGVSHACGHDAHTAMLLSAVRLLQQHIASIDGTVLLCFERAEEGGGPDHSYGVEPLLRYLEEASIQPDRCFALHVSPQLEAGKISVEPNGVMAGSFGFEIRIRGAGGHGSRPDLANNPLDAFVAFYQTLSGIRLREINPYRLLTFSIPVVRTGTVGNVIEEELYFEGTARALDRDSLERFRSAFLTQLDHTTAAFGCTYEVQLMYLEAPLCNQPDVAATAQTVVRELFGPEHYEAAEPNLGSESFAHFTERYPGAMAFLGIRNAELGCEAPLHSPRFDLDESALPYGAGLLAGYALKELQPSELGE
jgi:amidohydrolase